MLAPFWRRHEPVASGETTTTLGFVRDFFLLNKHGFWLL